MGAAVVSQAQVQQVFGPDWWGEIGLQSPQGPRFNGELVATVKELQRIRRWIMRLFNRMARKFVLATTLRWMAFIFRMGRIPSSRAFAAARWGWGNTEWPADEFFLRESCRLLRQSSRDALECGSGLSTVIYSLALRGMPTRLVALEHHEGWFHRVNDELDRLRSTSVQLVHAPLKHYGEFDWYTVPKEVHDRHFGLVFCDGPPGDTLGGRYGLLPVTQGLLQTPTTILLDDSSRPGEQLVLKRWASEFGTTSQEHSVGRFAIVTVNDQP